MKKLSNKVGEMNYDGLIADMIPHVQVTAGVIAAVAEETVIERGTLLSKDEDGKLIAYDGSKEPYAILCDEVSAGTEEVSAVIYSAGCFNANKVIGADKLTDAHKDELRKFGIVFKAML